MKQEKKTVGAMIIETKKLKDLKPNPINPRKSSVTQDENLRKSLEVKINGVKYSTKPVD